MPHAAIFLYDGCYASSACGFADLLQVANAHLRRQGHAAADLYEWDFVSFATTPTTASNGLLLQPCQPQAMRERYDLVFVPGFHYSGQSLLDEMLQRLSSALAWLTAQWQAGAWIAANCTGTFILAQTGLLDGKVATTSWWLERQFRSRFPQVDLQLHPVLTEADGLLCAGASASYLLQTIRVIERFSGAAIAAQCAKTTLIDVSQNSQIPYLPLLAERPHSDPLVQRAQDWLQAHIASELRISDLADTLAISERTLIRRFQNVHGLAPLAYLQDLRLEAARALLETSALTVEQIASQVGYANASSFSRLFRQRMGMSPGAYRARFQSSVPSRGRTVSE